MRDSIPDRYELSIEDEGSFVLIQGMNFAIDKELCTKIVENIKRNIGQFLAKCKNCEKPFIRNSPTHEICWRCKSKSGDVEL